MKKFRCQNFAIAHDKRLAIEIILQEPLVVALPENHPLATKKEVRVRDLADEPFITFQRDRGCGYDQVIAVCRRAGFSPRVIQEADEMQVILGFVAAGLGITLLSASAQYFQRPRVVYRKLQPSTKVGLALAWRHNRHSAVLQAFTLVVREYSMPI